MTETPILVHRKRVQRLQTAISWLQDGATDFSFEGVSYAASDLGSMFVLLERLQVKAAIEAIEVGNQSYQINGLTYTRAELASLYARDRYHEARQDRRARGGIRLRFGQGDR